MPDITMCEGKECPLKKDCYRYNATPNKHRQSFFTNSPNTGGECDYYWGNRSNSI